MDTTIDLSSTQRHVLLILANYAGEDGRGAFPAVATVARQTGLSKRAVQAAILALADRGAIVPGHSAIAAAWIGRADRRPNVWDLAVPRGAPAAPGNSSGVQLTTDGVQLTPPRGAPAAPDPLSNRKSIPKEQAPAPPSVFAMRPEWVAADSWEPFVAMRKSIKHPLTESSAGKLLKRLGDMHALGHDANAILDQSTRNDWRDVYLIKPEGNANATTRRTGESVADRSARLNSELDARERARGNAHA